MMKSKFLLFLLISVFCVSMTACGDSEAKSVQSEDSSEAITEASDFSSDADDEYTIPDSVLNLTEEEDILLTGVLKDNTYTNEYFGYVLTAPEGMTLSTITDPGEDGELMRFRQTFTDGFLGILIDASSEDMLDRISVDILDLNEDQIGLTEDELIKSDWEFSKKLSEEMEVEDSSQIETIQFAGEDHPAIVETYTSDDGKEMLSVRSVIPKGNFEYSISFLAADLTLEDLLQCIQTV